MQSYSTFNILRSSFNNGCLHFKNIQIWLDPQSLSLKSEGNLVSGLILQPEDKAECGNKIQPERWLKYVYERKEKNV